MHVFLQGVHLHSGNCKQLSRDVAEKVASVERQLAEGKRGGGGGGTDTGDGIRSLLGGGGGIQACVAPLPHSMQVSLVQTLLVSSPCHHV